MGRKKKALVTPVTPQKTEDQPTQAAPQAPQKDATSAQISSEAKPTPTMPKP